MMYITLQGVLCDKALGANVPFVNGEDDQATCALNSLSKINSQVYQRRNGWNLAEYTRNIDISAGYLFE